MMLTAMVIRPERIVMLGALLAGGCGLISGADDLRTGPGVDEPLDASLDSPSADGHVDEPLDASAALDATPAVDTGADAAPPPRCDIAKPFGAPELVGGLKATPGNDIGFTLSPDETTIYFSSDRPGGAGGYDLYSATRADADQPFSAIAAFTALNTTADERHPSVTADGLALVFRTSAAGGAGDLLIARRTSTAASFDAPLPLAAVNSSNDESDPFVTPSGDALYLLSNRGPTGIYVSARVGQGFGAPLPLPLLAGRSDPTLSDDELTMFIGSGATGPAQDIAVVTRSAKNAPFGAATTVAVLNSASADQPDWLSPDGCRLYLSSTRSGTYGIYVAIRPR